jgi:hypothetical protein
MTWHDVSQLQGIGPGKIGYSRLISVATPTFIREHHDAARGAPLPPLDHDGIDDAFIGKASIVWFWSSGRWLQLAGAD